MELTAYIQLGFAAGMAVSMFFAIRGYMNRLIQQNEVMAARVTNSLENHLSSIARSLALTEERLRAVDRIPQIQSDLSLITRALVNSTIVPPGTKVTVEPMNPNATQENS